MTDNLREDLWPIANTWASVQSQGDDMHADRGTDADRHPRDETGKNSLADTQVVHLPVCTCMSLEDGS